MITRTLDFSTVSAYRTNLANFILILEGAQEDAAWSLMILDSGAQERDLVISSKTPRLAGFKPSPRDEDYARQKLELCMDEISAQGQRVTMVSSTWRIAFTRMEVEYLQRSLHLTFVFDGKMWMEKN